MNVLSFPPHPPALNVPITPILSAVLFVWLFATYVLPRLRRRSIKYISGPPRAEGLPLVGHVGKFYYQDHVGDLDFAWAKQYGNVFRIKGVFDDDVLYIADPKAIQYIFHTSGYSYIRPSGFQDESLDLFGKGVLFSHGESHQRQRRVINPAFSAGQIRSYLPLFQSAASNLSQKFRDVIQESGDGSEKTATINLFQWLPKATLDALGSAALGYRFGALDGEDPPLSRMFGTLFRSIGVFPPTWQQMLDYLKDYHPAWLRSIMRHVPTARRVLVKKIKRTCNAVAKELVDRINPGELDDKSRDAYAVLARANMIEEAKHKISEEEVYAQLGTLMIAGTATSSLTIQWILYELAKNPTLQDEVRKEIRAIRERKGSMTQPFDVADLDGTQLTVAVQKEALRFHPIIYNRPRKATKDDIIPLSEPVISKTGEKIYSIPISKGQQTIIGICAYQRLKSVWGEDADRFDPHRWMNESNMGKVDYRVGMTSNLMVFAGGVKGCIGWRFAMIEIQAIVVDLIENFKFSLATYSELPGGAGVGNNSKVEIRRTPTRGMQPTIIGRADLGNFMPLKVEAITN